MGDHRSQARHREGTHWPRGPFRILCGNSTTAGTECAGCAWDATRVALHRQSCPSAVTHCCHLVFSAISLLGHEFPYVCLDVT